MTSEDGNGNVSWSDPVAFKAVGGCLLYTSDAADERSSVDLGGRRIIKKKTHVVSGGGRRCNTKIETRHMRVRLRKKYNTRG